MSYDWSVDSSGQGIVQEIIQALPKRIFDIHAHTQRVVDLTGDLPAFWPGGPVSVGIDEWSEAYSKIFKGLQLEGGLFFPGTFPLANGITSNQDLIEQLEATPNNRGLILVKPGDDRDEVIRWLQHPQIVGMKPYYMFSTEQPVLQSSIKGFFPEWLWQIAHEFRSVVMMHLVRDKAVSDPGNLGEIRAMCTDYPGLKLVLAHVARSFHYPNVKGIVQLTGLDNVYFDMSAICESEPIHYLLKRWGSTKLMWGSDFPISHLKARAVTVSNGFAWLDEDFCDWKNNPFGKPTLLTIESLRALLTAIDQLDMGAEELDNIFYANAMKLLGMA